MATRAFSGLSKRSSPPCRTHMAAMISAMPNTPQFRSLGVIDQRRGSGGLVGANWRAVLELLAVVIRFIVWAGRALRPVPAQSLRATA